MPTTAPTLSWTHIRNYTEKFRWTDPRTNLPTEGYNPPSHIPQSKVERVPFSIKYLTLKGKLHQGWCVCLKVDRRRHQRLIQYVNSGEMRLVRDYLILEINGTRFVTRTLNDHL